MKDDSSVIHSIHVGVAMMGDIACNYPLWIAAKRVGANLSPFPSSIRLLYKGGGALWLSLGPTTMVEDKVTYLLNQAIRDGPHLWYHGLFSAATSGMVAALLVTSQVEYLITASHTKASSVGGTVRTLISQHGIQHLLLPPGMLAMVGREVPFASALFYVRPVIYENIHCSDPSVEVTMIQKILTSLTCGVLTSVMVTPISQAPSVIASYQQGHSTTISHAMQDIQKRYGWKGYFRGLVARTVSLAGTFTVVPLILEALHSFDSQ